MKRLDDDYTKVAVVSDLHGEFLDKKAWELFLQIYKDRDYDQLVLNGDTLDFPTISRFANKILSTHPETFHGYSIDRELDFVEEEILQPLHEARPDTPILMRLGNHEERFVHPTKGNSNAIEQILETSRRKGATTLEDLLNLEDYNAEMSYNAVDVLQNKLAIVHGTWLSKNRCEKLLAEYGMSGTSGHSHKMFSATQNVYKKPSLQWQESGCMRKTTDVEYQIPGTVNDWQQGFVEAWIKAREIHLRQHRFKKNYQALIGDTLYER